MDRLPLAGLAILLLIVGGLLLLNLQPPPTPPPQPAPAGPTLAEIQQTAEQLYPGQGARVSELQPCDLCNATSCVHLPSCWVVNASGQGGGPGGMAAIGPGGAPVLSAGPGSGFTQPIACAYYQVEPLANGSVYSYNYGCDNPLPVCDQAGSSCRTCSQESECVRKKETKLVAGSESQVFTFTGLEGIGTALTASYNDLSLLCIIKNGAATVSVDSNVTVQDCEQSLVALLGCAAGSCGSA